MLHHGYVSQVLRGRGIQPPHLEQIAAFLRGLDTQAIVRETERLRRIALGVDASSDVPELLEAIRAVPTAPSETTHVTASRPRVERPVQLQPAKSVDAHTQFLRDNGVHIYGRTAALKIELDCLGSKDERRSYTVQVEGARKNAGTGFAWDRKIQFQVTTRELPLMAAFLLGFAGSSIEFNNHGPSNDKSLSVHDQGRHLFVRVRQQGTVIPVPVEPPEAYTWGELCLLALQLSRPALSADGQLAMLRRVGRMATAAESR